MHKARKFKFQTHPTNPNRCFFFHVPGEVSSESVSTGTVLRGGERVEAADLGRHTANLDETTLAANTAIDARGGSPQGAHLSGAVTPRPPRGRRRQNQNGLDTTQVCLTKYLSISITLWSTESRDRAWDTRRIS